MNGTSYFVWLNLSASYVSSGEELFCNRDIASEGKISAEGIKP